MFDQIKTMFNGILVEDETLFEDFVIKTPPSNYVVFWDRRQTSNFADGKPILNTHNCVLDVFENHTNKKQLAKQVEDILIQNEINFIKLNIGYLSDLKKTQITFEFNLI